ncbi:AAA family ATPase [Streptomyces sp. SL13]|uniref:AAA family ATPase n=1 Tax=Streptantibioticus silvisoli TaxID=2705255 RepID=A0AA90KBD7_9ACTN|nr:AAA family ATPase [Streptantibioticus silvisoli]MDI5973543.1 AAA family ATPase [Streptantibioticus silvisoli]
MSELADLLSCARAARAGKGNAVLVRSVSGMHCAALLGEVTDRVRRLGSTVVSLSCSPSDARSQFALVRQLAAAAFEGAERDGPVEGRGLLGGSPEDIGPFDHRFLEALWEGFARGARWHPLVVVVDHIQWMDETSLRCFGFLVRRLSSLPVLLILGCRTDEIPVDRALIGEISKRDVCRSLTLSPLSARSVRDVVESAYPGQDCDHEFVRACADVTQGCPSRLESLLASLTADRVPPRALQAERARVRGELLRAEATADRLLRQPADHQEVAEVASVLGEEGDCAAIADMLNLYGDAICGITGELARVGVFRAAAAPELYRFSNAELRRLIHRNMPPDTRRAMHLRAARRLDDLGAPLRQVAEHLLQTDVARDAWAGRILKKAADDALRAGDPKTCAEYARRVLRDRGAQEERAEALWLLGRAEMLFAPAAADRHLDEAVRLFSDPRRRNGAIVERAYARILRHGNAESALRPPPTVLACVDEKAFAEHADTELMLSVRSLTGTLPAGGETPACGTTGCPAPGHTLGVTPGERELLAAIASDLACRSEPRDVPLDLVHRALAGERPADSASIVLQLRCVTVLKWAGHLCEARRGAEHMLTGAPERDALLLRVIAHCQRAEIAVWTGDLPLALTEAERALALTTDHHEVRSCRAVALTEVARARGAMGHYEESVGLLQGLRDLPANSLGVRGAYRLRSGDLRGALADLMECGHRLEALHIANPALSAWRGSAALAWKLLGNDAEARGLAETEVELARRWGNPAVLGRALRSLAGVTSGAPAECALAESVSLLEQTDARLQLALSLVASGRAQRRGGHLAQARRSLHKGMLLAEQSGAHALRAQAHTSLLASGGRLRRASASGPTALTPTERRIALHAARGRTNKGIADLLHITPRTVEVHLTRVYSKLSISGRGDLADALGAAAHDEPRDGHP